MSEPTRNVAVLLAGGVGTRVGLDIPKQLIKIAGRPIMEHTLAILDQHPDVDEIIVMMAPGHLDAVTGDRRRRRLQQGHPDPRGCRHPQRHHAARARKPRRRGLQGAPPRRRPAAGQPADHHRLLRALDNYAAVDVAIPSADTIIEVDRGEHDPGHPAARRPAARADAAGVPRLGDQGGVRTARPGRRTSWRPTTAPSCCATSPTSRSGWCAGDERNMKVTEPIDVYLADKLFQLTGRPARAARRRGLPRGARRQDAWSCSAAATASAPTSRSWPSSYGANVATFSRSSTGTHVERREDIAAAAQGARLDRARLDRLRRQHRRGAAPGHAARDVGGDDLRRDGDQLHRARS